MSTAAATLAAAVQRRADSLRALSRSIHAEPELAFYDALPELGHACGHNIIAALSVGAALTLCELANKLDLTIKLVGTPAEESGAGKVLLLQRGVFDDVAMAMMVHPAPEEVCAPISLAITDLELRSPARRRMRPPVRTRAATRPTPSPSPRWPWACCVSIGRRGGWCMAS